VTIPVPQDFPGTNAVSVRAEIIYSINSPAARSP
jgi:hypothetical protein